MTLPLETPRLRLRAFQMEDAADFAAYRSDPLVARYQGWQAPFSLDQAHEFIAEMQTTRPGIPDEWYQIAIELKQDGRLIGDCAFYILPEDGQQAEIGFTLTRAYQGQGLATEAVTRLIDYLFDTFQLHRLRALCDVDNRASSRLLERVGMRREAHFIENFWSKGEWRSEYGYGLLRRERNNSTKDHPILPEA
ncbi:MAG: GNAT family N-acetyltransferase [Anaerolineae bacterium]|nr:GNAT family N-acetyltransferase [Anaerolineae bacterium]MCB9108388.1 GNAT family N-acetyltransferase [Anaerolineales bacterium]